MESESALNGVCRDYLAALWAREGQFAAWVASVDDRRASSFETEAIRRRVSSPALGLAAIGRQAAARPRHDCRLNAGFEDCRLIQSAILVRFGEATITTRRYRARQRIAHTLTGMDCPASASRRPMK
jgi:hypothetical protein